MVDRLKRMINASGFKVWPAEVEAMLYQHPMIQEVCIIGARDAYRGETVKAVVVPRAQFKETITESDIVEWAREHMAAYKIPRLVRVRRGAAEVRYGEGDVARAAGGGGGEGVGRTRVADSRPAGHARTAMSSLPIDNPSASHLEPRIARLEAHAEHTIDDLREIRTDLRDLSRKVDQHFHWLIGAMGGLFFTLGGMMARGFHWI